MRHILSGYRAMVLAPEGGGASSFSAQADAPLLSVADVSGAEDGVIALQVALEKVDPGEALSLVLAGLPAGTQVFGDAGATAPVGVLAGDGSVTLLESEMGVADGQVRLWIRPPADLAGTFAVTATAISTEIDGSTASATADFTLTVDAVAGDVSAQGGFAAATLEDQALAVAPQFRITDADGSETLGAVTLVSSDADMAGVTWWLDGVSLGQAVFNAATNRYELTLPADALVDSGNGVWSIAGLEAVPAAHSSRDVDFALLVETIDGGQSASKVIGDGRISVLAQADAPVLSAAPPVSAEGSVVPLSLSAALGDLDGSESFSALRLRDIPADWIVRQNGITLTAGANGYVLDAALLGTVTVEAPADFGAEAATILRLEAVVTDTDDTPGGSDSRTVTLDVPVTILPVADVPSLVVRDARGQEDGEILLDIRAAQTDADGSEALSLIMDNVPAGAVFRQNGVAVGTDLGGGRWSFDATVTAALATFGLTIVPPADSNAGFTLSVTLVSQDGGSTASACRDLAVEVRGVADTPLGLPADGFAFTGMEDQAVALDLSALAPRDADGSERLSVVLGGLPAGFQLTVPAGYEDALIYAGPNRWIVAPSALGVLSLVPPADFSGSRSFTADVIVTESDGAVRVDRRSVSVAVDGVADAALITLDANGTEDAGTPFALSISVSDGASATDPAGETVTSVIIDGLPAWATLTHPTIADLLQPLGNGAYQVDPATLGNLALLQQLQVLLPEDFGGAVPSIGIHVTIRDSNGDSRVTDWVGAIQVAAVADIAVSHDAGGAEIAYALADVHGASATGIVLPITATSSDDDGSETLSYEIAGVPEGVLLSHGSNLGGGVWHVTATQYAQALAAGGLTASVPNASAWGLAPATGFTLSVRAVSHEANGSLNGDAVASLTVTWDAGAEAAQHVADPRTIATDFSGAEDNWIALNLTPSGADLDGGNETVDVVVTGLPAGARLNHGSFDVSTGSWVLSPADLADLAVLPPHNFSGDMSVGVRVIVTEAGGDVRTDDFTVTVHLAPVSDAAIVSAQAQGLEDQPVALTLSVTPGDTTGVPETITAIRIHGVPAGASLSAGTKTGDGTWSPTPVQLAGLTLTPPAQWSGTLSLGVEVTSQDGAADPLTVTRNIDVTVTPVADTAMVAQGQPSAGAEDTAITLDLSLIHADTDGSEVVSVMISGLPDGSVLSAGIRDEQGNWLLTPSQLAGLTVRPPADWSGTLELTVTATSLERGSGAVSSVSLPVTVQVAPVADKPVSDPVDVTTDEDVPVALSLHLAASDDSETVGARIAGVPAGATFTRDGQPVGTLVATADGTATWLIDAADVAGLTLVPPPNGKGTWTFEVTPVSSDGASTRDGEASPLVVHVNPVSDAPTLSVTGASGNEDTRIPLDVRASLTDASEVLTATISDIPSGASLWWNGTRITVTNGVATLNAAQLSGLSLSIQPRGNSDVDFVLRVQAFSRDGGASPAHSQEVLLPVTVLPVSDLPNIPANALSDDEDSRIVLPTATLADTDGSETLTEVVISGIPDGATLRSGETVILVTNGTALLPIGLRANLTLQTKQDYSGSFSITYSATSQDGTAAPATRTRVIPVTVRPVSDLPTLDVQPAEGLEDTRIPLAISAAATDIDGSETLSVSISDIPTGSVLRSGETVIAIVDGTATLTSDQLAGLTIQPPPDHETDFTLTVRAISTDGSAAPAVTLAELPVNVIPVNDAPGLIALSNATVAENAAGATIGTVAVSDPDTGDSHTFSLSDDRFEVADGQLKLKAGQSLDHEAEPTVTLSITATDIAGLSNTQTFSLTVTDVNEAPVLDPSASPAFAAIFENAVDPQGGTVAAMIVDGSITDPDGLAVEAIAVVGMTGNGTWQYWTGSAWTAVGAVGENNALLLDAADRMRFIPAANWSGTAGISFRAWDKSAGTAHTYADVTAYGIGGSTPFSVASDTATLEVARLPRLSISDVSVQEGSTAILTLVFDQVPTSPVTVTWSSADGSATAASGDYQIASGTITFAAGETSKTITVLTHDDGVSEGSETVLVNLTGVSGAVVADGQGVITLSDAPAPIYWMDDLTNGLTGYTLYTNTPVRETYLGQSTQYLGDINGDGFGDFVASVYQEEGDWADLHVVTGSARGTRAALTEVRAAGFEIEAGAQQGIETATAADVDGDGTRELVLGVTGWVNGYWAKAYVLDNRAWSNGVPANSLLAGGGYTVGVPSSAPSYGAHMEFRTIGRGYGDFNGDGRDDFVGSEGVTNTSYGTYAGATAVVFGQTGTTSVASLTGSNGFEVFGSQAGEESGYAAQFIGDINGDGYDDVLIGAPGYDADGLVDAGRAMVVFGRSGAMPSAITPEWLNGSNGFTISGPVTAAASLGWWISELGDVNGDGVADFAMNGGGAVYVVYGHGGEWAPNLDLAQLDGTTGFRILGGGPVASAGDINGDGYDDIVISMQGTSDQSSQLAVVYGGRSMPAVFDPTQMEQGWGFRILGSAGDYSWGSGTWGSLSASIPAMWMATVSPT
ncbi:MAG: Ig-like domain-containing protein [Magnetospirillum sp.]|nr:Ig-like domain-containing protein [Magnetospirillum sp.]